MQDLDVRLRAACTTMGVDEALVFDSLHLHPERIGPEFDPNEHVFLVGATILAWRYNNQQATDSEELLDYFRRGEDWIRAGLLSELFAGRVVEFIQEVIVNHQFGTTSPFARSLSIH